MRISVVRNQLHGKTFEDQLKAGLFRGASDQGRSVNAGFDIEASFDRDLGLPTSVKASGGNVVTLADARRFWAIHQPFRMLIGRYRQLPDRKEFYAVEEFLVDEAMLNELRGEVTEDDVAAFHDGVGLAAFPTGQHQAARAWAANRLSQLKPRLGLVGLNRKIDSKGQRRLQASVSFKALHDLVGRHAQFRHSGGRLRPTHRVYSDRIGDIYLPLIVHGGAREFNP